MKIYYDNEVDALYLEFGPDKPDGVTEISEGVHPDMTPEGKIAGIEIINASGKLDIQTILCYSPELDNNIFMQNAA